MSRLAWKGILFSGLFLFFYKNRLFTTFLILIILFMGMEGGKGSPLLILRKGLKAKDWFISELKH